jgi:hypothetical protein
LKNRDFLLSSGLKNHRGHRGHREKRLRSVLFVYSVVDQHCSDSFFQNKLKSLEKQGIDRFMNEGDNISIVLNSIELEIMKYTELPGVIINGC